MIGTNYPRPICYLPCFSLSDRLSKSPLKKKRRAQQRQSHD